jgi:hypothetical protein
MPPTDCPYCCWAFRHFDYCIHTDPIPDDSDIAIAADIERIFDRD